MCLYGIHKHTHIDTQYYTNVVLVCQAFLQFVCAWQPWGDKHTHTVFFPPVYSIVFISGFSPRPEATCHSATCLCASVWFWDATMGLCVLEAAELHSGCVFVSVIYIHTYITVVWTCMFICWYFSTFVYLCVWEYVSMYVCLKCCRINYCDHTLKLPRITF